MNKQIQDVYNNLDWILERMDDLSEKINDYVFFSCCDLDPTKANLKRLKELDRECNELKGRYDVEMKILKKMLDSTEE
jgi:hypothetical protein